MSFLRPTPDEALVGLRIIKTVTTSGGPLDPTRRGMLTAIQKHVLHTDYAFDALETITPEAAAQALPDPALRDQLARAICLQVMIADAPPQVEIDAAERFVRALDGSSDALERMRAMYEKRMLTLRFDAMRNSFMGDSTRRRFRDEGVLGVLANLGQILGIHESEKVAGRYRALAQLPEASLGRALYEFYSTRGFAFPGEKDGAPESIIAHDLTHVLIGASTDLQSEAVVTAFQAGYRREGPITGMQFVVMNMQKGVQLTKLAATSTNMFAEPAMAERIVEAFARGTSVTQDLVADWDYWDDMERPLAEVRKRLHVTPFAE